MLERGAIFTAISEERARQDAKWGVQHHVPATWALIAAEECGGVAKAVLEGDYSTTGYIRELVQLAAVCVAAIECASKGPQRCEKPGCFCCPQLMPDTMPPAEEPRDAR